MGYRENPRHQAQFVDVIGDFGGFAQIYSQGWLPDLEPEPHDIALDALLNDKGVAWSV